MRTLADLKRELPGKTIILLERFGKPENKKRVVTGVKGNCLVLKTEEDKTTYLEIPKASLLEYDVKTIKVFNPGVRDFTEEENRVRGNVPRDAVQEERDMMTDGSTMYYRRKQYYKDQGYEYLAGASKAINGLYLTTIAGKQCIRDDAIKGTVSLLYEVKGGIA